MVDDMDIIVDESQASPEKSDSRNPTPHVQESVFGDEPDWAEIEDPESCDYYEKLCLELRRILYHHWGFTQFKDGQLALIISAIEGRHVSLLQPTGSGKSLCFQIPAIYQDGRRNGVTIVIEPTQALVDDQHHRLTNCKVPALKFHGGLDREVKQSYIKYLNEGYLVPLIYLTPEQLGILSEQIKALASKKALARFVFDEAHLMDQWGGAGRFREEAYKNLTDMVKDHPTIPWTFVSGSMSLATYSRLVKSFGLPQDTLPPRVQLAAPNMCYEAFLLEETSPRGRSSTIARIARHETRTIVFCATIAQCKRVEKEFIENNIATQVFHSGQKGVGPWFDRCTVIISTVILAQGVDLPDVNRIIIWDIPQSLEMLIQQTGRAGRAGQPAVCTILMKKKAIQQRLRMIFRSQVSEPDASGSVSALDKAITELREVIRFCTERFKCRHTMLYQGLANFYSDAQCHGKCDNCYNRKENLKKYAKVDVTHLARRFLRFFRENSYMDPSWSEFSHKIKGSESLKKIPSPLVESLILFMIQEAVFDIALRIPRHGNNYGGKILLKEGPKAEELMTKGLDARLDIPKKHFQYLVAMHGRTSIGGTT